MFMVDICCTACRYFLQSVHINLENQTFQTQVMKYPDMFSLVIVDLNYT